MCENTSPTEVPIGCIGLLRNKHATLARKRVWLMLV